MSYKHEDHYNRLRQEQESSFRGKWIKFVTSINVGGRPNNYSEEEVKNVLEKRNYGNHKNR